MKVAYRSVARLVDNLEVAHVDAAEGKVRDLELDRERLLAVDLARRDGRQAKVCAHEKLGSSFLSC
jgi:hypothetical protein